MSNKNHNSLLPKIKNTKPISLSLIMLSVSLASNGIRAEIPLFDEGNVKIDLSIDGAAVGFTQNNPWFGDPEGNIGVDTNSWSEYMFKPGVSLTIDNVFGGEIISAISAVGTKTFGESADGLAVGYDDPSDVTLELAYIGWRKEFNDGDSFEFKVGNLDYQIATAFLIKDGGSDGGDRGGFYLGGRSAFHNSFLASYTVGNLLLEGFWLENNPRRDSTEGTIAGFNVEYNTGQWGNYGFSYIDVVDVDDAPIGAIGDKLSTYDFRAQFNPIESLSLSGEYSFQTGASTFEGQGWWLQAENSFDSIPLQPTLTYRYAAVTGDNPNTTDYEAFEPLAYGFNDYSQWYQGEIAGNWIFANSNQLTHIIKGSTSLTDSLTLTGVALNISIDQPQALGITNDHFGNELDIYLDWEVNDHLFISGVVAALFPGSGAKQFSGDDRTWMHFMLYASFSF